MIDIEVHGNPLSFDESVPGLLKKVLEECERTGRMSCVVRVSSPDVAFRLRIGVLDAAKRAAPPDDRREAGR